MKENIEKKILDLFQYNHKLKFSGIEDSLKIRSNKIAYHIKNLVKKNVLIKEGKNYLLSEASEYLVPYLSEKHSVLPVVLIHIGDENKAFLYKRTKRPYKDFLSLPGGRILLGESIKQATERLMKEKFNISVNFKKINSISLEHVKKKDKIIHSFFLIFVTATTVDNISLINLKENKNKIISSDYELIINDLNKQIDIKTIFSNLN